MASKLKPGSRIVVQRGPERGSVGTVLRQQGTAWLVRLEATPTRCGRTLQLQPGSIRRVGGEGQA